MNSLMIKFVGDKRHASHEVPLEEFIIKLRGCLNGLIENDKHWSDGEKSTDFFIIDLKHSSPATVTIGSYPTTDLYHTDAVMRQFWNGMKAGKEKKKPEDFTPGLFKIFKRLADLFETYQNDAEIYFGDESIKFIVQGDSREQMPKVVEENVVLPHTVEGIVDNIQMYKENLTFHLYPKVSPVIKCAFSETLIDDVIKSRGKFVAASGLFTFNTSTRKPLNGEVDKLRVFPDLSWDEVLDLRGSIIVDEREEKILRKEIEQ